MVGLLLVVLTFSLSPYPHLSSPAVWLKRRPDGESHVIEPEESVRLEVAWRTSDGDVEINGETVSKTPCFLTICNSLKANAVALLQQSIPK